MKDKDRNFLEKNGVTIEEQDTGIVGRLGNWTIRTGKSYFEAQADNWEGLPLDVAEVLYNTPHIGPGPKHYGKICKAEFYSNGREPRDVATPSTTFIRENMAVCEGKTIPEIRDLVFEGEIDAPLFVKMYRIDTYQGMEEFVKVVRSTL